MICLDSPENSPSPHVAAGEGVWVGNAEGGWVCPLQLPPSPGLAACSSSSHLRPLEHELVKILVRAVSFQEGSIFANCRDRVLPGSVHGRLRTAWKGTKPPWEPPVVILLPCHFLCDLRQATWASLTQWKIRVNNGTELRGLLLFMTHNECSIYILAISEHWLLDIVQSVIGYPVI